MTPESSSAPIGALCETLFELFSTAHGSASVGRMLKGIDIGRFVLLREARVELTFDPPWNQSMMSDAARLQTGMF